MPAAVPPFRRLLSGYKVDNATGCWIWQGHTYPNGYGTIKVFGKMASAHKYSWELHRGPVPEGLELLHSCDVALCINPDHMRPGTHKENMQEAAERGRMPSGKDHPMTRYGNPRKGSKSRQSIQVRVLGKVYGSIKEAEKALYLGGGTVRYWINNFPMKAQIITKSEYENNAE